MICTEEEAKTKWCPFVRTPVHVEPGYGAHLAVAANVGGEKTDFPFSRTRCIGSACMAWRATDNLPDPPTHNPNSSAVYAPVYKAAGYCGLAGDP